MNSLAGNAEQWTICRKCANEGACNPCEAVEVVPLARAEATEKQLAELWEALYTAEEFIVTVQKWMGGPEDQHETLDELRAVLARTTTDLAEGE